MSQITDASIGASHYDPLCIYISSDPSPVAVYSLQTVSDIAIHCSQMQIGRATIQKNTVQNNYLPLGSHAHIPFPI